MSDEKTNAASKARRTVRRRALMGTGRMVVTRDPLNLVRPSRLNLSTFASRESAADFVRRAEINGIRVLGVL